MSVTESPRVRRALPMGALLVLAASVFLSITTEMLPTGLLPEMSRDLGVGEPLIGLLVSVFAFTVVVTSAPLTALLSRMPRRTLLVAVLVLLAVSTALSAVVGSYAALVAVRIIGGVAHGLFWALVAAAAARLVPDRLIGRAVSIVLGGGTLALVLGVPASTMLGQLIGWRAVFGLVAVLTLVGAIAVRLTLPQPRSDAASAMLGVDGGATDTVPLTTGTLRAIEPAVSRYRRGDPGYGRVLAVCLVTAMTMLGQYAMLTYVAPIVTDIMGFGETAIGPMLLVYGVAGALGLVVAGLVGSQHGTVTMVIAMLVAAVSVLSLLVASAPWLSITLFALWAAAFGALPPLLQTRLLESAPPGHRDAASALYTTAFNLGIGGGALVGALLFGSFGLIGLPVTEALAMTGAALIVVAIWRVAGRRTARTR